MEGAVAITTGRGCSATERSVALRSDPDKTSVVNALSSVYVQQLLAYILLNYSRPSAVVSSRSTAAVGPVKSRNLSTSPGSYLHLIIPQPSRQGLPKGMSSEFPKDIIVIDDDVKIEESQKAPATVDAFDERRSKCVPRTDTLQGGTPPATLDDVNGDETESGKNKNGMLESDVILIDSESCRKGDTGDLKQSAESSELAKEIPCKYCRETFNDPSAYDTHRETTHSDKLYVCPYCPKGFRRRLHRDNHADTHEGKKPFKCEHCSKLFATSYNLEVHNNIHLNLRQFACRFCTQTFIVKSNRTRHERMHTTAGPYECNECRAKFKNKFQLTIHLRKHPKKAMNFKCSHCDKTFLSSESFEEHLRASGCERSFSSVLEELVETNDQHSVLNSGHLNGPEDEIALPECVYSDGEEADAELDYGKREAVIANFASSTATKAEHCESGDQANSRNTSAQQSRETFCCYSCGTIFMEFGAYRGHYQIVHPDMIEVDSIKQIAFVPIVPEEMSCQYCLRIFNNKDVYHSHMENAHLDKLYTCPLCPKTFRNEVTRGRHIDDAHEVAMENGEPNIQISI